MGGTTFTIEFCEIKTEGEILTENQLRKMQLDDSKGTSLSLDRVGAQCQHEECTAGVRSQAESRTIFMTSRSRTCALPLSPSTTSPFSTQNSKKSGCDPGARVQRAVY